MPQQTLLQLIQASVSAGVANLVSLAGRTGAYGDLTGRPALATVATSGVYNDLSGRPALATVATSGSYGDLSNRPIIVVDRMTTATPNPATNGLAAVDTTTPIAGERWLLTQNGVTGGIWVVGAGAWVRAADYNSAAAIRQTEVWFRSGTGSANGMSGSIRNTNATAITVGTTSLTYAFAIMQNGSLVREGFWGPGGQMGYEGFANGGTSATHNMIRATGANGTWTFVNAGTGLIGFQASGGIRLGNASANAVFDIRAGTAAIPASQAVASGADYDLSIVVAGALNNFGTYHASTQGVAIPAGIIQVGCWCAVNGTVVVRYRNVTGVAINWPATATNVRAVWLSI